MDQLLQSPIPSIFPPSSDATPALFADTPVSLNRPQLKYAAAFIPKGDEVIHVLSEQFYQTYLVQEQTLNTGEDSFFVNELSESHLVIGVSDGVGGWCDFNHVDGSPIDPSIVAKHLMAESKAICDRLPNPSDIMQYAFESMMADSAITGGSATCSVVSFTVSEAGGRVTMNYSNLGDSIFMLFDEIDCVKALTSQTVGGGRNGAPFQFSKVPRHLAHIPGFVQNHPAHADSGSQEIVRSSILVLASDGVWDNLKPHQVQALVDVYFDDEDELSFQIVNDAFSASKSAGGKPDDISCVVVRIIID